MKFAWVKLSVRTYMAIEYDGASYRGDFDARTGRFEHRFRVLKTGLNFARMQELLDGLESGKIDPADLAE